MSLPDIKYCPGTLKKGYSTYSNTALKRVYNGKKVSHILPYNSPKTDDVTDAQFNDNRKRMSISGVQEKFSVLMEKNKLRLIKEGEHGEYILKPVSIAGRFPEEMPANEHVTMQIARQVFGIETAENAMIFFQNGEPAYITKRFETKADGSKWAQEDFASLAGLSPATHGEYYKYQGSYLDAFHLLKKYVPAYDIEAIKLFRLVMFNYLFSNGDVHFKNFSLIETPLGDFKLSPAYDLLNSRIHIEDKDFALEDGLLPLNEAQGRGTQQFYRLGELAGIDRKQVDKVFNSLTSNSERVYELIDASYLSERKKISYRQAYETRLDKLLRGRVTNTLKLPF